MQLHFTSNEVVENDVLHVPLRLEHFGLMQGVLIVLCVVCEWILSSCVRVCVVCSHRIVSLCVCVTRGLGLVSAAGPLARREY